MHAGPGLEAPVLDWLDLHPDHQSSSTDLPSVSTQTLMIAGIMVRGAFLV